jgi:hypothetical protein
MNSPACRSGSGERAVDGCATDAEAAGDLGRTDALGLEAADLIRVDRGLAAPVDALRLRPLDPVALALPDELQLRLGDHAEDRQHHLPHRPRRRDVGFQNKEECAALVEFVHQVENVPRGAPDTFSSRTTSHPAPEIATLAALTD